MTIRESSFRETLVREKHPGKLLSGKRLYTVWIAGRRRAAPYSHVFPYSQSVRPHVIRPQLMTTHAGTASIALVSCSSTSWLQGCMSGAPVASGSDTCIPSWRHPTCGGHWSPSATFSRRQDTLRSTDAQQFWWPEVSVLQVQARGRGTACHRTYDKTWTFRVSSINWKHFCLGISQPRRIVTVCCSAPQKYSYLLTYL